MFSGFSNLIDIQAARSLLATPSVGTVFSLRETAIPYGLLLHGYDCPPDARCSPIGVPAQFTRWRERRIYEETTC